MNDFNKHQKLYCQYCGKECISLNSLRQHEIRCRKNENKIICKGGCGNNKGKIKGYKWLTDGINQIFVSPNKFNEYLNLGWHFGISNITKEYISKSLIGKPNGKASTEEKELERKKKISNSMKGNTNWMYNKHHGNAKQGWYNGIHCDSTWELAFLVYYKEHNLYIERCKEQYDFIWENKIHKYIPDFITDEGIIEIKGRKTKKSLEKENQFPQVKVIDTNLIKPYLDYVINKYGDNFWKVLYE